jgi:hypothetical protein
MLKNQNINIKIYNQNIKYYKSLGYYNINVGDIIEINLDKLNEKSCIEIEAQCDYCGKTYNKRYVDYTKNKNNSIVKKDACCDCKMLKMQESNFLKYGTINMMDLPEIREKIKNTNILKYGIEYYTQTDEYKNTVKETNLEKYGVENVFQNKDIQEKQKQTNIDKYGVGNVFQSESIKQKSKNTIKEKYGVDNIMQIKEIAEKVRYKTNKTMNKNGTQKTSKQQKYLYNLLGGELNYLYDNLWLDIAFLDLDIYIEYQGSGHNIDVKYKKMSQEDFLKKEIKRYKFLKSRGWKQIEIISKFDYLPQDNQILDIFNLCLNLINNYDLKWVKVDIDNNKIIYKNNEIAYVFNKQKIAL